MEKNKNNFIEALKHNDAKYIIDAINQTDPSTIASFVSMSNFENRTAFTQYLNGEILIELPFYIQEEVINIIGLEACIDLLGNLPPEDIWDFISDRDSEIQKKVINSMPSRVQEILKEVLSYPEESAGRLINKDYVMIPKDWLAGQAVDLLRTYKKRPESLSEVFVVDESLRPIGSIKLLDLLCTRKNVHMSKIMDKNIQVIKSGMDQEDAARIFQKHSLHSAPVINEKGTMIGIIHVGDVIQVIQEEAEEDMMHLGGVWESDLTAGAITTILRRLPWLMISFVAINLVSIVVGMFGNTIESSIEIAILMPVVAAMGGNSGIQASTVAVRAIALGQLTSMNALRLLIKESIIGITNGLIISLIMFTIVMWRFQNLNIAMILSASIIIVFAVSTFTGAAIPLTLHRIGVDPALASSVMTSAITDLLGFTILLLIATYFLIN